MKKKKLIWQIPFLLILIIGTIIIIRQQHNTPYQKDTGFIFGTIYHITYQSDTNYQQEIETELKKVDQSLSPFNKTSVITQVNQGKDIEVDEMFTEVFRMAESISKETNGAFDITVAPMVNLWGFGFKQGVPPTKVKIDSIKTLVGHEKVALEKGRIIKQNPKIMLDCSAIAKGYGSDIVARFLKKKGISNFMVEIGGEIVVNGVSEKQVPWHIGINKPTDDSTNTSQEIQDVLDITDIAMATSGNYRNFYYKNGKKYAHTIDPKTGYPVQHNILSATVLAKNCATADAYATSFMVMGMEGAKQILKKHPDLCAYLIYADEKGQNKISTSLKPKVLSLMDEEIKKGTNGRIIMKMNSVTDVDFIQKVSEASNAGVRVDLIVRGICCILPGVKGYTENLRVTSIVGRYLEHPRIFLFGTGADQKIYIGSADMMTRNTEKRVEVACPVYDETIRKQLTHMLKIMLADNVKARELKSDGKYYMKEKGTSKVNSQEYFMREAITVRHPEGRTKQSFVDKIRKIFRRK